MTAVIFRYCLTLAFRGEKDMKKEVMEEINGNGFAGIAGCIICMGRNSVSGLLLS